MASAGGFPLLETREEPRRPDLRNLEKPREALRIPGKARSVVMSRDELDKWTNLCSGEATSQLSVCHHEMFLNFCTV